MTLSVGSKAPDFTLPSDSKEMITLSAQRSENVLLLFFPFAYTGVCTQELCSMRDSLADYNNLNAKVYGISVDSPFTLAKFKEDNNLNFTLLSDFNKDASKAFGCLYDEFALGTKGVSKRSAFVIDREGAIRYAEINDDAAQLPDFAAIKKSLQEIGS